MSNSLNLVLLRGNLGKDVEIRFTASNIAVSSFSIATTHSYKGKDGNWVNDTTWHDIIGWKLSDYVLGQLKKGKEVEVQGRIAKRNYTDKEGVKRYVTEIIAEKVMPINPESNGANSNNGVIAPEPDVIASAGQDDDLPFN